MAEIKTKPISKEYDEGFDRTFGERKSSKGGRWVLDPKTGKLVPAHEYDPDPVRSTAHRVDLYLDGMKTMAGEDIGSMKKRREYMKRNGVADFDDFKQTREKAKAVRESYYIRGGPESERKKRREQLARIAYQKFKW